MVYLEKVVVGRAPDHPRRSRVDTSRGIPEQTMVVLLAAGKGTRMGRSDLVKVCFEIDSMPAINRQIAVFKRQRFSRFLVVVGTQGDQVLDTVSKEHSGVLYVHQEPQLGTGHAAKIAAEALQTIGYQDYVLVTMGDKYLEENALAALVDGYVKQRADMALLTIPKTKYTEASAGRVFVDEDGQAVGHHRTDRSGPATDRRRAASHAGQGRKHCRTTSWPPSSDTLPVRRKNKRLPSPNCLRSRSHETIDRAKLEKVLQAGKYNLGIGGKQYPGKQIERLSAGMNPSLYLMRAEVFYQGVGMIRNDNAQGEYYITDMVRLLSGLRDSQGGPRYRRLRVPLDHPEWVQGFNWPDELLAIRVRATKWRPCSDTLKARRECGSEGPPWASPTADNSPTTSVM